MYIPNLSRLNNLRIGLCSQFYGASCFHCSVFVAMMPAYCRKCHHKSPNKIYEVHHYLICMTSISLAPMSFTNIIKRLKNNVEIEDVR